jgi:Tfp pilus assembly protein PilF
MGSILRARGDLAGAEREMRRALEVDPGLLTPRLELARILTTREEYREAEAVLEELLEMDPHDAEAARAIAFVRARQER